MGTAAAAPPPAAAPDPETMAAGSAGADAAAAAVALLLVACLVVDVEVLVDAGGTAPPVGTVAATLATLTALDVSADVVTVAPIVGGRLEAKTGDGSICCTKFDGKTPTLLRRRPRHQPSST